MRAEDANVKLEMAHSLKISNVRSRSQRTSSTQATVMKVYF